MVVLADFRRVVGAILMLFVFYANLTAGGLRTVWDFELRKAMRESAHIQELPVFALRFSPNGLRIAAVVHFYQDGQALDRLLVVHTERPESGFLEFDIPLGVFDDDGGYNGLVFDWTASGDSVILLGDRIQVEDRRTCSVLRDPGHPEFIPGSWYPDQWTARLLLLDAACKLDAKFEADPHWQIMDASPNRRLLCVWAGSKVEVVDPIAATVIRSWPRDVIRGKPKFADNGRAICEGSIAEHPGTTPISCWEIATGQKIAEDRTINGGMPFATAALTSRLVGSDYVYVWNPFMDDSGGGLLKRRVVWDFGDGRELAAWRPQRQQYTNTMLRPPKKITSWFNFALSPDGRFIAEGGNGILRLHKVEP